MRSLSPITTGMVPAGAAAGRTGSGATEDQEAEQNKTNLLQQRDTYYATVRKPQPVPATLERIPGTTEKETGSVPARRAYLAVGREHQVPGGKGKGFVSRLQKLNYMIKKIFPLQTIVMK